MTYRLKGGAVVTSSFEISTSDAIKLGMLVAYVEKAAIAGGHPFRARATYKALYAAYLHEYADMLLVAHARRIAAAREGGAS